MKTVGAWADITYVHELFQKHAGERKAAVAVAEIGSSVSITYGELHDKAQLVANGLTGAGIGVGDLVSVEIARSSDFIAACLGAMYAGCGFVPVDPTHPASRTREIRDRSGVRAVLTERSSEQTGIHVELVGEKPDPSVSGGWQRPQYQDTCYVCFTSGSTGKPKGVAVGFGALAQFVSADELMRVQPGSRTVAMAAVAFDAIVFEVWATLAGGGEVHIIPADVQSAEDYARHLVEIKPDHMFITTGLFHLLAKQYPDALALAGRVITGGEAISPTVFGEMRARLGDSLVAAYGPTETVVFSTCYSEEAWPNLDFVPLGTCLTGKKLHLLDERLQPVPEGETGEIYVEGYLATGYLADPARTAGSFIASPFSPGERMYRTGDLARCESGYLSFQGRVDRQIKVRGYRVELDEVEAAILALDDVSQAVVTATRVKNETRLIAYVVKNGPGRLDPAGMRRRLHERLPAFMLPNTVMAVDELPLTPSGKVDRTALPAGYAERDSLVSSEYTAPTSELEQLIADIFAEELALDRVGRDDDLFELGGSSLTSMTILERVREAGHRLSARLLFIHPQPAALARALNGTSAAMEVS